MFIDKKNNDKLAVKILHFSSFSDTLKAYCGTRTNTF